MIRRPLWLVAALRAVQTPFTAGPQKLGPLLLNPRSPSLRPATRNSFYANMIAHVFHYSTSISPLSVHTRLQSGLHRAHTPFGQLGQDHWL